MDDWNQKQETFLRFLEEHQAHEAPYRVDLGQRKIFWVDEFGLSLVVADCKVLLSYALSNRSIMMAWANDSLPLEASIDSVEGLSEFYEDCTEEDVWELSVVAADSVQAQAIYRTPSPQSWVMLGIWNLRPGGAEQFVSGSPQEHVVRVLQGILDVAADKRSVLLDNYAESFLQMASHPYRGTEYAEGLRDLARDLRNLLGASDTQAQDRLRQLLEDWG